jgi:hypothetical protein
MSTYNDTYFRVKITDKTYLWKLNLNPTAHCFGITRVKIFTDLGKK